VTMTFLVRVSVKAKIQSRSLFLEKIILQYLSSVNKTLHKQKTVMIIN